jgi:hypothetical protein
VSAQVTYLESARFPNPLTVRSGVHFSHLNAMSPFNVQGILLVFVKHRCWWNGERAIPYFLENSPPRSSQIERGILNKVAEGACKALLCSAVGTGNFLIIPALENLTRGQDLDCLHPIYHKAASTSQKLWRLLKDRDVVS